MKVAAIVCGLDVHGIKNIQEVIDFSEGKGASKPTTIYTGAEFYITLDFPVSDFSLEIDCFYH